MSGVRFVSPLPHPSRDGLIVQPRTSEQWNAAVKEVKKLYVKCHYKQCASRSEQLLNANVAQIQPIHQAYLYFFIAICYESLGTTAHEFSSKKLPHLEKSKAAFISVSKAISQARLSQRGETYDSRPTSSGSSTSTVAFTIFTDNADPFLAPSTPTSSALPTSDSDHGVAALISHFEELDRDLWIANPSPTSPLSPYSSHHSPPNKAELMPKPLFITKRKLPTINNPQQPRPLPPLPIKQPSLVQQRKPAIPLAINTNIMITTPPPPSKPEAPATAPTHLAPRPPIRPLDIYHHHRSLTRYNTLLTSFSPQIATHISFLTTLITTATIQIADHRAQKAALKSTRLASFWCLRDPSSPSPLTPRSPNIITRSPGTSTTTPPTKPRLEAVSMVKSRSWVSGGAVVGRDTEEQRRQRIERLRANGWQVRKEERGWKGVGYYEGIRRRAGVELWGVGGEGRFLV